MKLLSMQEWLCGIYERGESVIFLDPEKNLDKSMNEDDEDTASSNNDSKWT